MAAATLSRLVAATGKWLASLWHPRPAHPSVVTKVGRDRWARHEMLDLHARRAQRSRPTFAAVLALLTATSVAANPLRVVLIAPTAASRDGMEALRAGLTSHFGFEVERAPTADGVTSLAGLRTADAVIVHRGPGALSPDDAKLLRQFLAGGRSMVIIAATPEAWPSEPQFGPAVLGATPDGPFAGGAPLRIINLFPHPIFTGVTRFETDQPVLLYAKLGDDAQMIMEGTVGEATAPLAWVRRTAAGSLAHFVFDDATLLADPTYQRILGHALLWAARRPIPGAQTIVQRTFMPESYPGAFAITLPEGPGVCLDLVRGGINYIWAGDFVDLRPRWITKQGEPARIFGPVHYREREWQPFRAGSPDAAPDFEFQGYVIRNGTPEFHYRIGGRDVFETFSAGTGPHSLVRRFRVAAGTTTLWLRLEPQTDAELVLHGLERDGNVASFSSRAAGEFTIEIRPKLAPAP